MKNYAYSFSKFGFAMLILFVANAARVVAQEVSSAGEVKAALRLIDIEKPSKAIESLNALVSKYPTDATVLYSLGYAYIKKGELDKASAEFDKGIKLNDKEPINYVGKGYVSLLKNNQADSKLNFDKAQALAKKNAAVLNGIAEAYLSNKQLAGGALDILLKSKSINAKDPATLILLGDAYLQANDGGKAVSSYEDAALVDPKNGKPHFKIGAVYNRSKNTEEAIKAFTKAVTVDPEYAPAFKELGEIYYTRPKSGEGAGPADGLLAVKAQESYLAITENPEPGKVQLAFYYFLAKDYTKANEIFKQVVSRPDVLPIALKFFARSSKEKGEIEQSRQAYEQFFSKAKKEEIEGSDYITYA
ncbi:MAG TPA: tetratricopeptide repeat protein, partial [Cyclobacteriaceae bacterium]